MLVMTFQFHQKNEEITNLEKENQELRNLLEEHQATMELIMSRL